MVNGDGASDLPRPDDSRFTVHPSRRSAVIGTAGWTLPRQSRAEFPLEGSHLQRYAGRFRGVEINSSFYRQHRRATYERWGAAVPAEFRFAVKLPRAITHDQRLVAADVLLEVFLDEACGLGERLGPLLVQLPPSLALDVEHADEFFTTLRALHGGDVVCEPRHASWFTPLGDALLTAHRVARAGADPALSPEAAEPGGWPGLRYLRLHGSPRMYYSAYPREYLVALAERIRGWGEGTSWCMFDNTTLGAAAGDALELTRLLSAVDRS